MKFTTIAALAAAVTLSAAAVPAGGALAQGAQPSGTRAGGPGQAGAPGQIGPDQRVYLRGYVARQSYAPVTVQERLAPGYVVPGAVELRTFPDTVYTDVPSARSYRYFSTGGNVVLVDPVTRQVVEVID